MSADQGFTRAARQVGPLIYLNVLMTPKMLIHLTERRKALSKTGLEFYILTF